MVGSTLHPILFAKTVGESMANTDRVSPQLGRCSDSRKTVESLICCVCKSVSQRGLFGISEQSYKSTKRAN